MSSCSGRDGCELLVLQEMMGLLDSLHPVMELGPCVVPSGVYGDGDISSMGLPVRSCSTSQHCAAPRQSGNMGTPREGTGGAAVKEWGCSRQDLPTPLLFSNLS